MGYTELTLIVAGAVDWVEMYDDGTESVMDREIERIQNADYGTELAELFKQYHGHDANVDECACAQYSDGDNNCGQPIWTNRQVGFNA